MAILTSAERFIFRCELRGEKRLFVLAALTTALAAAALALVLAISDTFEKSFNASSKTLLGGDMSVRLSQRAFNADELRWLNDNSANMSQMRVASALAIAGDKTQMVRIKTVDDAYPLYGDLVLQEDNNPLLSADYIDAEGAFPALVAQELLKLLHLRHGDIFEAVGLTLRIVGIVEQEPDPDSRVWMASPLVLLKARGVDETLSDTAGLLENHFARVKLKASDDETAWEARLTEAFPEAGWRVRRAEEAMPSLRRFVARMRDFLSLMSLAAMLIAGIGVGGAASAFLRARTRAIAVIKMLGGSAALVRWVYLGVVFLFVISGALAGTLIGGGLLFAASPYLSASLPVAFTPEWPWSAMARAFFVALMMGAAFVAAPVLRFSRVNPLSLFGATEDNSPPPPKRDWLTIGTIWTITILAIPLGWREKIAAAGILAAAAIIYGLSVAIAGASEPLARRCPPPFSWGLLAIARNRRQTAAGIVSFSIGMALLIGILNIESNFAARIDDTLRREAPTLYFIGIREEQEQALREAITDISPTARLRTIPFLRGRIVSIGGRAADTIEAPDNLRWILRGDRGLTWTIGGDYIGASQVSAGKLWNENIDAPQISFDAEAGEAFGMELGDTLELNILGRRWSGIVTSFRDIDWQSFDINFVIMMNQRPFGNAPYSLMGAAFLPPADETLVKLALAKQFPNVTPLSTGTAFELIKRLLRSISFLLQLSALFLLVSGIPVVVAALMDGQRRRADEATTLRLLGASTKTLALKGFTEFAAMAGVALLPALIFGLLASKLIVEFIFELKWQLSGGNPFIVVAAGIILFLIAGCLSVIHRMKQSPLALMRND